MVRISSEDSNLWQLISKIKKIDDNQIELVFSQNSPLLENFLAFKIIKGLSETLGKEIIFNFEDRNFSYLEPLLNAAQVLKTASIIPPLKINASDSVEEVVPENQKKDFSWRKIFSKWPKPIFKFNSRLTIFLTGLFFLLILVFVSIFSYYYFVPKTQVSLVVESEPLVRTFEVTAVASASSNLAQDLIIPAIEISTGAKKSQATASSGKKDVGDKALGSATIYNKTSAAVTLAAGTVLGKARINGDDLRFLTRAETTAPARTVNSLTVSGYDPGTVAVDVVAEKFGEDYNLPSGSTFTLANKSTNDFIADNANAFSGGSHHQAIVVAGTDQKTLLENLTSDLKDQLKTTLLAKLISGQNFDENSINFETKSKAFDHGVGEEADRLSLTLEMNASVLAFSQDELKKSVYGKLLTFIPDGYQLFGQSQEAEVLESKLVGRTLKISVRGKGFIVPKIDADAVKRQILGKSLAFAEDYLASLPNLASHKISQPLKLGPFSFLPFRVGALTVEVVRK